MIQKSFIFLDKIGKTTEKNLWEQGIRNWDDFLNAPHINGLSSYRKGYCDRRIQWVRKELYRYNAYFFNYLLPKAEMWRIYSHFKEDAVFLDIETTGLRWGDDITVVGLFNGIETKMMIKDINLNYTALKEELSKYKLILTFNGAMFDLPFIEKRYPGVLPKVPHIDLRTVTGRLGYKGGLKKIEKEFGVERRDLVDGMSGGDAVTLWRMYKGSGDDHYLNLLVEYNEEDIINLKKIADICTKRMENQLLNTNFCS